MNTVRTFTTGAGTEGSYYSLPALAEQGFSGISRMPVSLRIVLESLLRNCDGLKVTEQDVKNLAAWNAKEPGSYEIPFTAPRCLYGSVRFKGLEVSSKPITLEKYKELETAWEANKK